MTRSATRWAERARDAASIVAIVALVGAACTAPRSTTADARDLPSRRAANPLVRIALAAPSASSSALLDADGSWRLLGPDGRAVLAHARAAQGYRLLVRGRALLAEPVAGGFPAAAAGGTIVARPDAAQGTLRWNGRRYRGELLFTATDTGVAVVNRLPLEDYLRGVVPREVGSLAAADRAAVEAQAVAARSYAVARLASTATRPYDLTAAVGDQVYGGADAERAVSDAAVAATAGEVLLYAGRVVQAPYSSTCGGSTAEATEVWQGESPRPYLRAVSDQIPGTSRYYCDVSPRFTWRRTFDGAALDATVVRYLRGYAAVPAGGPGRVRSLRIAGRTPTGRVAALAVHTDAGEFTLRGNAIRFVLRGAGGEILNSTYFDVETMLVGRDGRVAQLALRGGGNGHGVGMCQWGAIGRARAGDDYRAILRAYYPGTTVGEARAGGD